MNRLVRLLLFFFTLVPAGALRAQLPPAADSPVTARESLRHFDLAPGMRIEVAAAEPQVVDPVAVRFDSRGRMWVVEMRDYPHGPAEGEPPLSTIRLLEDRDDDGYFEQATIFADKLLYATGLQPWRGGVIVTLAGRVAYMEDTSGDGRADLIEDWYEGFAQENAQLRANHPRLAMDNQLYVANGLRGGSVRDSRKPESKAISISGMDFRFNPRTFQYQPVSGVGQFGLTFDDEGNRFVCSNRNPLKQVVLENRYLVAAGSVAIASVVEDVARSGETSRIYPISRAWTTSTLHAGQFTAACGVLVYRGTALAQLRGHGFTCDPTGNLVHVERLVDEGVVFRGQPVYDEDEFLRSTDEWFRPVNLELGPDGALYIVDMYRAVVEHPQWVPAELKDRLDNRYGDDRGRIYRVVASDWKRKRNESLDAMETRQLVKQLAQPNAWQRDTAARLLLERSGGEDVAELERVVRRSGSALARMHAIWLLDGLQALGEEILVTGLHDPSASVRRQSVRIAEAYLEKWPGLEEDIKGLVKDEDPRVRFQVLLSARFPGPEGVDQLVALSLAGAGDPWMQRALRMAAGSRVAAVLEGVLGAPFPAGPDLHRRRVSLLAELAASSGRLAPLEELASSLESILQIKDRQAGWTVLAGLLEAARRRGVSLQQILAESGAEAGRLFAETLALSRRAVAEGRPADSVPDAAIRLLAFGPAVEQPVLEKLLVEGVPEVRVGLVRAYADRGDDAGWEQLMGRFKTEIPRVRRELIDGLLRRESRIQLLLGAIEAGSIRPSELDAVRTRRLTDHGNTQIRERARKLFAATVSADRQQVLADYQQVLTLTGRPQEGEAVFRKNCATCHRIGTIGVNVAPDIADSRSKQPQQILLDILQPNRVIDSNYLGYTVLTTDGRQEAGILASETTVSITLKQPEGKTVTFLRRDIETLQSSGISLMPVGLEKNIDRQQMADLISFIKNWRYLDGKTPLARPLPGTK
ncbi:MAG: PVC-type heme-binding CxxCH protein [Pirellulaceae bacterium]